MLTSDKDLRKILKRAAICGWSFKRGSKHIKAVRGSESVVISSTPSDGRVLKNIEKDLKL
jgi:hypothetical protein